MKKKLSTLLILFALTIILVPTMTSEAAEKEILKFSKSTITKYEDSKDFSLSYTKRGVKDIKFQSSNKKVAKISSSGKVSIKGDGTTKITVSATGVESKKEYKATTTLKVKETSIKFVAKTGMKSVKTKDGSVESADIYLGDTGKFSKKVTAQKKTITLKSSNEKVAKVTSSSVKAVGIGTATITATLKSNSKCKVSMKITVIPPTPSFEKSEVSVVNGKKVLLRLENVKDVPKDSIKWSSSDSSIVSLDISSGGKSAYAIGNKKGTATISAKVGDKSATCKVTVTGADVSISKSSLTIQSGKTATVTAKVKNALSSETYTWSTSNDAIVKIESSSKTSAKIKAVGAGTANVTITLGSGATASCEVTVEGSEDSETSTGAIDITVSKTSITIVADKYTTVTAKTSDKSTVTWESQNPNIASVEETGTNRAKITAMHYGTTTITATSNGSSATINVEVPNPTITISDKTVKEGKTVSATASVKNMSKSDNINWTVANENIAQITSTSGTNNKTLKITGVSEGTTTITGSVEGTDCTVSFTVTVTK